VRGIKKFLLGITLSLGLVVNGMGGDFNLSAPETQSIPQTTTKAAQTTAKEAFKQAYETTKQTYSTVKNTYSQVLQAYNYGVGTYQNISSAIQNFKKAHGLGKISALLGGLAQFGILDQQGYAALSTILETVNAVLNLPSQVKWPPDFIHGLPQYVQLGKQLYALYNQFTKGIANLDKVGINLPNQYIIQACLDGKLPKMFCEGVLKNPAVFGGGKNEAYSKAPAKEVQKKIKQVADAVAVTSNVDNPKVTPKDEVEMVKGFNARNVLSTTATISKSTLLYGKEFAQKLPKELRPYYNFIVTQQASREAYIKGLRESLQIHYQKAIALKHLIEQVCDTPVETPPPTCNGGGLFGALGSLSALASLNPSTVLSNIQDLSGAIKQIKNISDTVSQATSKIQNISQVVNTGKVGEATKKIQSTIKKGTGYLPITTRCCCSPCTPAVHSAEAHISSQIASAQASINARITAAETALVNAIAVSTQQIVQAIQTENCLNRMRLKMEFDVLRGQQRLFYCTLLKLKLAELLVKIDSLDAQVTTANAVLTQLQNSNYELYDQERKQLEERGYELIKGGK